MSTEGQSANQSSVSILNSVNDPLFLTNSDHPGMSLTNAAFNGSNFLPWSRTVKMVLGAKLKLGFIDGSNRKPAEDHVDYQRWIRCDYMVTCWLLNSMVNELSDAFLYAQSAYELWKEITERYVQSNGPLIYQLEHELTKITQANLSIAAYFNKLKRCWDELSNFTSIPSCSCGKVAECSCGITDKIVESDNRSKLIQFLMKLNDEFKSLRTQILSMDPLPNISKTYYIVQQVEKQKQVTHQPIESTAFFANLANNKFSYNGKKPFGKAESKGDIKKHYNYCKQDGHMYDQCFERIGYPDWYKGKKAKKGSKIAAHVNFMEQLVRNTPFDMQYENGIDQESSKGMDHQLVSAVYQEMMRLMKGK